MSQADRELVLAIRAELAAIDPARPCDRLAESLGLGSALSVREAAVARLAVRLGRETADAGRPLAGRRRTKHVRVLDAVEISPHASAASPHASARSPDRSAASDDPSAASPVAAGRPAFDWANAADHCRFAYLRGRFLARGSLSLASARSHLEFVVDPTEAPFLAAWLAEAAMPASWRIRRGRGVVTWKSAETVGLFLRRIGARASLLELEARQVSRDLRGELNRVLNAESANLQRAVAAAGRQLDAIERLEANGRLALQPLGVREVAQARRDVPEATLGELAERLQLHRSSVQRALERIEHLALHEDEDIGRRVPRVRDRGRARRPPLASCRS